MKSSAYAVTLQITPGERATLQLLANGEPTHEIACRLGLNESEVEVELSTLFEKIGARNRTEAVATAGRRGLLTADALHAPKDSENNGDGASRSG